MKHSVGVLQCNQSVQMPGIECHARSLWLTSLKFVLRSFINQISKNSCSRRGLCFRRSCLGDLVIRFYVVLFHSFGGFVHTFVFYDSLKLFHWFYYLEFLKASWIEMCANIRLKHHSFKQETSSEWKKCLLCSSLHLYHWSCLSPRLQCWEAHSNVSRGRPSERNAVWRV